MPDSQIYSSWSVGIGFKVWERIDRSRRVQEEAAAVVEVDESSLKEVRPKVRLVGWAEATLRSLMLFLGRHPGPSPAQAQSSRPPALSPPTLRAWPARALARV